MYIDIKVAVWNRLHLPKGTTPQQAIEIAKSKGWGMVEIDEFETLYDSEEIMTPEQNNGEPTIEVYMSDKDIEPIYNNSTTQP